MRARFRRAHDAAGVVVPYECAQTQRRTLFLVACASHRFFEPAKRLTGGFQRQGRHNHGQLPHKFMIHTRTNRSNSCRQPRPLPLSHHRRRHHHHCRHHHQQGKGVRGGRMLRSLAFRRSSNGRNTGAPAGATPLPTQAQRTCGAQPRTAPSRFARLAGPRSRPSPSPWSLPARVARSQCVTKCWPWASARVSPAPSLKGPHAAQSVASL